MSIQLREYQQQAVDKAGGKYVIIRSLEEFIEEIKSYLINQ